MKARAAFVLTVSLLILSAMVGGQQNPPYSSEGGDHQVTCRTELAPMRDGTMLATDVYLPAAPGRYPVVLERTPYGLGLGHGCFSGISRDMAFWAEHGYVALTQDSRGTFRSQGTFNPFFQEQADGYDAVEWAAAQSWSTGKVAMTGVSYFGVTQWQAALTAPPHLVAIAPGQTATDYHDHWTYVNGVFDLWFGQSWILNFFAPDAYRRQLIATGNSPEEARKAADQYREKGKLQILNNWTQRTPLKDFEEFRSLAPYYYEWLDHPNYDDYWARIDVEKHWSDITVPALVSGGWSDLFTIGSVRGFNGMTSKAGSSIARDGSRLVMLPGGHGGTGVLSFVGSETFDLRALQLRFFDYHMKGSKNDLDREPRVRLFVQELPDVGTRGGGFWLTSDSFPPADATEVAFHLRSHGHATTRLGDGMLDREKPPSGPPDSFTYEPMTPVLSHGGGLCCTSLGSYFGSGAQEQTPIESRRDVLVFTSEPLSRDLTVVGPVTVTLWAKSSARDTDFTAKLVDVQPGGFAYNVVDRVLRTRFRNGSKAEPSLIEPNKPYEYSLELGYTATVFRKGHRVRLDISSSKFPQFARNLNTGTDAATENRIQPAVQTILHDPDHASRVELSIIPNARDKDR
jgi:putative CocE/NonD family hydrolase